MTKTLLQSESLAVHYGGICALDGVDFEIRENEIVAIMGPNGAGKSTILKAFFGLAPITGGVVCWQEKSFYPGAAQNGGSGSGARAARAKSVRSFNRARKFIVGRVKSKG